jgi:hypothetical protein
LAIRVVEADFRLTGNEGRWLFNIDHRIYRKSQAWPATTLPLRGFSLSATSSA